jgi:hypothetical protein
MALTIDMWEWLAKVITSMIKKTLTTNSAAGGHKQKPRKIAAQTPITIPVYRVPQKIAPNRSDDWSTGEKSIC